MCIPIVTIFPATAAMFGVIRQWKLKKDSSVFVPFFRLFKDNFKQSFIVGIIFFIFVSVFYLDFMLIATLNSVMQNLLIASLYLLGIIVLFVAVYLFPIMVHYNLTLIGVIKSSFFYSVRYLPTTILSIIFFVLMATVLYLVPVLFLVGFSFTAYIVFTICHSRFIKTEELIAKNEPVQE